LEKLASRKLRINAKETMKIAEKLYTQGYISYPRTETNIFPKDFNLPELVQNQVADSNWGGLFSSLSPWMIAFYFVFDLRNEDFAANILNSGGPTPRNGTKSDQAHPPIHPTKYTNRLEVRTNVNLSRRYLFFTQKRI